MGVWEYGSMGVWEYRNVVEKKITFNFALPVNGQRF